MRLITRADSRICRLASLLPWRLVCVMACRVGTDTSTYVEIRPQLYLGKGR